MRIWVDADACPKLMKEILYRAAIRTKTQVILVANQPLQTPLSPLIKKVQVPAGFDVADNYIIQNIEQNELVVTADIPLADAAIAKGGVALNPRGQFYTKENIKQQLAIRDLNAELRNNGMLTGGPAQLSQRDIQAFANCLDKMLSRR